MMYIQDNDEFLLPWRTSTGLTPQPSSPDPFLRHADWLMWTQLIQPFLKNQAVLYCPSFNERVLEENAALASCDGPAIRAVFPARFYYAHFGLTFGYTGGNCTPESPRSRDAGNAPRNLSWITLAQVARPAETAVIQDNFTAEVATGTVGGAFG